MRHVSRKDGFTLIEIVLFVCLLAALACVSASSYGKANALPDGRQCNLMSSVKVVRSQVQLFKAEHGRWPSVDCFAEEMKEGYLVEVPVNPFTRGSDVRSDGTGSWRYDEETGEFAAAID